AAGANALAIAGGGGNVSLSGAIGFSVAVNTVSNGTHAFIDGATVTAAGDVSVESSSSTQIDAITVAGTEAGTASGAVRLSFEGVGAGSINTVSNTTEARISGASTVNAGGLLRVHAEDDASIKADGGALTVGIGIGQYRGVGIAGAAFAVNTITDTARATIDSSSVNAPILDVETTSVGRILAASVAVCGARAVWAGGGIALSGAAAATGITVAKTIEASVKNGSSVNAAGAAVLRAIDGTSIDATSGDGSLAGAGGPYVGLAGAVGIGLSANSVANTVTAFIDAATVTGGRVEVSATSQSDVTSLSVAGVGAVGIGKDGGALAGAGAGSGNTIADV